MNRCILSGHVAVEPERRETEGGIARANLRLAVKRRYKNPQTGKNDVDFITVICWRGTADIVCKYLHKGDMCAVVGSLQTRQYTDAQGVKHTISEIVADEVELLRTRGAVSEEPETSPAAVTQADFTEVDDDDLPF